jgi:hypothetical protein
MSLPELVERRSMKEKTSLYEAMDGTGGPSWHAGL